MFSSYKEDENDGKKDNLEHWPISPSVSLSSVVIAPDDWARVSPASIVKIAMSPQILITPTERADY